MYNIQKAVSRLDFAPNLKEIKVTDFQKGLGVFTPRPDKPVSFAALKETLKKAGYKLAAADITVAGTLDRDEKGWAIVVQQSGQRLALDGPNIDQVLAGAKPGDSIEITGDWKTAGTGSNTQEMISLSPPKTAASSLESSCVREGELQRISDSKNGVCDLASCALQPRFA